MKKYQLEMIESDVLTNVLCDICGKSCRTPELGSEVFEHSTLYADWGYCSKRDGDKWEADFCEECSENLKKHIELLGGRISEESRWS